MTTSTREPKTRRLHELLAIDKGVKQRTYARMDELQKILPKQDFFNGHLKKWIRLNEDAETFEPENKKVQFFVAEMLQDYVECRREVIDIEATKDSTNGIARADIVLGETVLASDVPATTLLFLEKELTDLRAFIQMVPTLDPSEEWRPDPNNPWLYKTEAQRTHRTKKVEKPLVLYEATKEHPAQTKTVTEDVVIGHWETVKITGAIPITQKLDYWKRVNEVLDAVKAARERANTAACVEKKLGNEILGFIFS